MANINNFGFTNTKKRDTLTKKFDFSKRVPVTPKESAADPFSMWGQRLGGKNGKGLPLDLGVTLAGMAAQSIAPNEWGGRMGKNLATLGGEMYSQRKAYERDSPERKLRLSLGQAQLEKAQKPELMVGPDRKIVEKKLGETAYEKEPEPKYEIGADGTYQEVRKGLEAYRKPTEYGKTEIGVKAERASKLAIARAKLKSTDITPKQHADLKLDALELLSPTWEEKDTLGNWVDEKGNPLTQDQIRIKKDEEYQATINRIMGKSDQPTTNKSRAGRTLRDPVSRREITFDADSKPIKNDGDKTGTIKPVPKPKPVKKQTPAQLLQTEYEKENAPPIIGEELIKRIRNAWKLRKPSSKVETPKSLRGLY